MPSNLERKKVKIIFGCKWDFIYIEILKDSAKNLLELINSVKFKKIQNQHPANQLHVYILTTKHLKKEIKKHNYSHGINKQ